MTAGNFTLLPGQATPYYPLDLQIAGYLANKWHTLELLTIFTSGLLAILGVTYAGSKRIRPRLSGSDLGVIMWFVMCGCIHSFFEGYFAYNYATMAGNNDLFGQLWKEYSLSDSRYLTQNAFVLCMESVTAVRISMNSRNFLQLLTTPDLLGPRFLHHRPDHRLRPPPALPAPAHRLARPFLRRRALLRYRHFRPLHHAGHVHAPRGRILLGLLCLYKRLLGRHSRVADLAERKRHVERLRGSQRRRKGHGEDGQAERQEGELSV